MSDETTRVTVFCEEKHGGDWMPENLEDAIAWLKEKLAAVPKEYRSAVEIEIGSESGYEGSHYASITITYDRPSTAEEITDRNTRRRERAEQDLARHEAWAARARKELAKS